jgi:hypothetical protein
MELHGVDARAGSRQEWVARGLASLALLCAVLALCLGSAPLIAPLAIALVALLAAQPTR